MMMTNSLLLWSLSAKFPWLLACLFACFEQIVHDFSFYLAIDELWPLLTIKSPNLKKKKKTHGTLPTCIPDWLCTGSYKLWTVDIDLRAGGQMTSS